MPKFETEAKKNLDARIEELEQSDEMKSVLSYQDYMDKLKALNDFTKDQYEKDRHGLNKALTPQKLAELKKLYADAGAAGELMLQNLSHRKKEPIYSLLENIQNLLARDVRAINAVDERTLAGGTVSLQRVIDDARVRTVDISGRDLGRVGANLSSRIPFNHVTSDGRELPGVFTPESHIEVMGGYDRIIREMRTNFPSLAPYFADYKQKAFAYLKTQAVLDGKDPDTIPLTTLMLQAMASLRNADGDVTDRMIGRMFKAVMPDRFDEFKKALNASPYGRLALDTFSEKIGSHYTACIINIRDAGVENHSRIDCRNSAMSSVADLLGVPDLICRATPMKIIRDGQEIDGTFMSLAEGVDIMSADKMYAENSAFSRHGSVFENTRGLKDIADLQVIDFICGNVDRHVCNMFYKFGKTGPGPGEIKFLGVQGIDNDASFGTFVPRDSSKGKNRLVSLDNMRVMSKSMQEKLFALSPEMLAFVLRSQGLEESQIAAAGKRLTMLKAYVSRSMTRYNAYSPEELRSRPNMFINGTIRVAEDSLFEQMDLTELAITYDDRPNTFKMLESFQASCQDVRDCNDLKPVLVPKKIEEAKVFILEKAEADMAARWLKSLRDGTKKFRSSEYYDAVLAAAERYSGFCENNKGAVLSEDLYAIRKNMLTDLRNKADAYAVHKKDINFDDASPYTKNRIRVVREIGDIAGPMSEANFYEDAMGRLGPNSQRRYADGLHEYADRALEDFNAMMRKKAEEIYASNPRKQKGIVKADIAKPAKPKPEGPAII